MQNKLPEYNTNELNEVLFIVTDLSDEKQLPIQAKEPEFFNKFFDEFTTLCAKYHMAIDSYGVKKQMCERLAKKEFEKYRVELPTIVDSKTYEVYMIEQLKSKV